MTEERETPRLVETSSRPPPPRRCLMRCIYTPVNLIRTRKTTDAGDLVPAGDGEELERRGRSGVACQTKAVSLFCVSFPTKQRIKRSLLMKTIDSRMRRKTLFCFSTEISTREKKVSTCWAVSSPSSREREHTATKSFHLSWKRRRCDWMSPWCD